MIWYDMICYDMLWYDMIWYDMIWYDMIWYDMMRYYVMMRCDEAEYHFGVILVVGEKGEKAYQTFTKSKNEDKAIGI